MRFISIEEHFASPGFIAGPGKGFFETLKNSSKVGAATARRLTDIGDARIAEMDAAGIDKQVLSLNSPGVEQADREVAIDCALAANDFLFEATRKHPTRIAGFASLPIQAPEVAAAELKRCVRELGFKGANINGHTRGRYLDDPAFEPILAMAEELDTPLYLHPTPPPQAVIDALYRGFSPNVTRIFSTAGWGWHLETATHLLRMVLGGVFDRHERLKLIIGHMGEALPFMAPRLNRNLPQAVTKLRRPVIDYLRTNVHYTFGGFNFDATFLNLLNEFGAERILFSVDYPFGSMLEARDFLLSRPISGPDMDMIAWRNAEKLLGLFPCAAATSAN